MNLSKIFDYVIPSGGVFYKNCNMANAFYKSYEDFIAGKSYHSQDPDSTFEEFVQKLIDKLIWEEKASRDPEPLVTTDYAIECALEAGNKNRDNEFAILHELKGTQFLVTSDYDVDREGQEFQISLKFWASAANGYATISLSWGHDTEADFKKAFEKFKDPFYAESVFGDFNR